MNPTDVSQLFGTDEPDMRRLNEDALRIVRRLDQDEVFRDATQSLRRAGRSIPTVALLVEHMMHNCVDAGQVDVEDNYIVFLLMLFILLIDDYIDEDLDVARVAVDEVASYTRTMIAACRAGELPEEADTLTRFIVEVTNALRKYETFPLYEDVYFQSLTKMLGGMVEEYRFRANANATDLDEYMIYASHSIGSNFGLSGALIVLNDPTLAGHKDRLWVAFDIVAAIMRYANDIRSYERELLEGNITSLQLAAKKFGISPRDIPLNQDDILRIIRASIMVEAFDLKDCIAYLKSRDSLFETVIFNSVMVVLRMYEVADFHTLKPEAPGYGG